jgi:hypothetical protein
MTNQEKAYPLLVQAANEKSLLQQPSSSQEDFPNLDEELLETITGGGIFFSKPEKVEPLPAEPIRTPEGFAVNTRNAAVRAWLDEHPTPEARANVTWRPKRINYKGELIWVKNPVKKRGS